MLGIAQICQRSILSKSDTSGVEDNLFILCLRGKEVLANTFIPLDCAVDCYSFPLDKRQIKATNTDITRGNRRLR